MEPLIYVADDEDDIRQLVKMFLESAGYRVKAFPTGDALFFAFSQQPADLVILDIMMPGTDGLTLCNRIRAISAVPIILLTAKDSDADYIAGITLGSDDYLTKPFRPTILTVRVKALLRRTELMKGASPSSDDDLVCGDLSLSAKKRCISHQEKEVELTTTEYACLAFLMKHYEETVSRETMLKEVWGYHDAVETRVTDETIRRIRKKLAAVGSRTIIANKWAVGYMLREELQP
ncbi:response regulator transcription factor [Paenibacillus sp. y28]|uniref:response regulator transcription factor n=1 Tax=Paenibacillus sp. y28 TaxID=3129110 RepID=UPI0030177DC1